MIEEIKNKKNAKKKFLPGWLKGKYLHLTYSPHSLQRMEERCKGCLQIKPSVVKLTEGTVVKWVKGENKHVELKVCLKYSRQENLILILQLDGLVKTLYFEDRSKTVRRIK